MSFSGEGKTSESARMPTRSSEVAQTMVRRIWRERPVSLGQPPGWQLGEILRALESNPWPADSEQWEALIARAIPAAAL